MRKCEFQDWGRQRWADAFERQKILVERRKQDLIPDQFIVVEHPHVITMGRNGNAGHVLASSEILGRAGIEYHETNRGGDVTYHGPGQIVGYPILNLDDWKRDVHAYVRALEELIIAVLEEFGIAGERSPGETGVWVNGAKVCAIGVHISRWVTSHGFALNVDTDLNYFRYIVPCGLTKPVTSMRALGVDARREEVVNAILRHFGAVFACEITESVLN